MLICGVAYHKSNMLSFLQDWNDLVAFLTAILNRCVSSHIS